MFQAGKVGDAVDQIVGTGVFVFGDQICLLLWPLLNHMFVFQYLLFAVFQFWGTNRKTQQLGGQDQ